VLVNRADCVKISLTEADAVRFLVEWANGGVAGAILMRCWRGETAGASVTTVGEG
jgi:hypothetical protein